MGGGEGEREGKRKRWGEVEEGRKRGGIEGGMEEREEGEGKTGSFSSL